MTIRCGNALVAIIVRTVTVTDNGVKTNARIASLLSRTSRNISPRRGKPSTALSVSGAASACSQARASYNVRILLACASQYITTQTGVALIIVDVEPAALRYKKSF